MSEVSMSTPPREGQAPRHNDDEEHRSTPREERTARRRREEGESIVGVHTALVFTIAAIFGFAVGALTYKSADDWAGAVLAGLVALVGSIAPLHRHIGRYH
jgi:hypothetical protein